MRRGVLAIDQGTTGTTALLFDSGGRVVGRGYAPVRQFYPQPGWVEHDPEDLWRSCLRAARDALRGRRPEAIGLTNQRETTLLWNRRTGRAVHRAIVWQDRRTAPDCAALRRRGWLSAVRRRTGLLLDPYFSGTKLAWLLRRVPGARRAARAGMLAFGTVDSWMIWKLTGGAVHATDPTNASRTMLFNIRSFGWDPLMLGRLGIPPAVLPEVRPSAGRFGETVRSGPIPAGVPVTGVAGDQQAALFGQGCVGPGDVKVTYGTGAFLLAHTGSVPRRSTAGLITTAACAADGGRAYALEGSVFMAGAVVQWLRDELGMLASSAESERVAESVPDSLGVTLVPAFTGLGAPYWDPLARGIVTGLTRGAGRAHLVRAGLEAIAYQTADVIAAMQRDLGRRIRRVRVDGGACRNGFLMRFQADLLGAAVARPRLIETTAAGAAYLAGIGAGVWSPGRLDRFRRIERVFRPRGTGAQRRKRLRAWRAAVSRARSH